MSGTRTTIAAPDRVEVAEQARSWLAGADYADAFRIASDAPHPAGRWARESLEGGLPAVRRLFALTVWTGVLGFRLGPASAPGHIAGWPIVVDEPGTVVLRVDGWLMAGCMVFDASKAGATWTTLLRYDRRPARAVWAAVGHGHRALAPRILGGAARSLARRT